MNRSPLMLFIKEFAGSFIKGDDEISVLNTKTPPLNFVFMVPPTGLEPVRIAPADFKSAVYYQFHHSGMWWGISDSNRYGQATAF